MRFRVWKGDITTLRCDAIVNAANESGLGCRIPGHCIDSAIHAAAEPGLYDACVALNGINVGEAKITQSFLPYCTYIIHTVGPQQQETMINWDLFDRCYAHCLELARHHAVKTIAFCCLSTGIFGLPKLEAAKRAIASVKHWLRTNKGHGIEILIFNVFTYDNLQIYNDLFCPK